MTLDTAQSRQGGAALNLELGGTIDPRLLLGLGIHTAAAESTSPYVDTVGVGAATLMARGYPSMDMGLYLMGGIGTGLIQTNVDHEGGGAVLGVGYDIPIGDSWQFTPSLTTGGAVTSDRDGNFANFVVGLTYH